MTQTVHLFKCLISLGVFLKLLEAFLKLISVEIIFAACPEGTKYGLTNVENCQEHVPVRLRISTKKYFLLIFVEFEASPEHAPDNSRH